MHVFKDRAEAGRELARALLGHRGEDLVVLGLPRGGVPVAFEVAMALEAPLDVIVVRKLGVPFQPELAMGALAEHDARVIDPRVVRLAGVSERELAAVEATERERLALRAATFRAARPAEPLEGRMAVVVDDGMATGSTARAACRAARAVGAARVILAVPVAAADTLRAFGDADEVVCLAAPESFIAVGRYYRDFSATDDSGVLQLLDAASRRAPTEHVEARPVDEDITISAGAAQLSGRLHLPSRGGVVVFAHGSGSSRHSPRNRAVARVLERAGLGTLLLDLLDPNEELDRSAVFDIGLLASRLRAATEWLRAGVAAGRDVGYFGASTGAAAALWAAAEPGAGVAAIVSRGGRPDLAGARLADLSAPTLLIVGGADRQVLGLNRDAAVQLRCPHRLDVIAGATHLFEEPGALEQVAALASEWFTRHLDHA
ncbi:phosphoribosyltransferase family protein [Sinomonas sp. P47F7]|uniref:phosphoribosyltransferase family protein n=1 Tax=Sinomonas sp. P47F7 TaxID=3410987 RepID=UPI003BF52C02